MLSLRKENAMSMKPIGGQMVKGLGTVPSGYPHHGTSFRLEKKGTSPVA